MFILITKKISGTMAIKLWLRIKKNIVVYIFCKKLVIVKFKVSNNTYGYKPSQITEKNKGKSNATSLKFTSVKFKKYFFLSGPKSSLLGNHRE